MKFLMILILLYGQLTYQIVYKVHIVNRKLTYECTKIDTMKLTRKTFLMLHTKTDIIYLNIKEKIKIDTTKRIVR